MKNRGRVLVAYIFRQLIPSFLCRYTTLCAVDALRWMQAEENKLFPDLILMNLFMPNMSGIEACRRIKAMKDFEHIPIIMITSTDSDEQIKKAFRAGATDFVSIPIREVEFIARVETALRLKREMDQRKAREDELRLVMKELNEPNQRLKELSYEDGLTGAYNRRYFDETLEREWTRSLRDSDTLARYGGEEFVVILPETDRDGAFNVARKLVQNAPDLKIPREDSETSPFVTISAGCFSMRPEEGNGIDQFVTAADRALYIAKQRGRMRARLTQPIPILRSFIFYHLSPL